VRATRQRNGEQRTQGDRDPPHELHACPPPTSYAPTPQVGDTEDYRGTPKGGTRPTIGVRHSTYQAEAASLRDSHKTRCLA
jgi:hypothetical protein